MSGTRDVAREDQLQQHSDSSESSYPCQERPLKLVKREASSDSFDDDVDEVIDDEDDEDIEEEDDDELAAGDSIALPMAGGVMALNAAIALAFPGLAARAKVKSASGTACECCGMACRS